MNTLQSLSLKKRKKGFTLTELAIVIAVIAILIAVLVPTFSSVITKARLTTAAEEAKNAITSYTIETNKGLTDGTYVAVDDTYYFEVSGNTVSTDNYSTDSSAISGLCPYQYTSSDAYASYNGKVVIYVDEASVTFPSEYSFTTTVGETSKSVKVDNSGLTITGSGDTYTITGSLGAVDNDFRDWWHQENNTSNTDPTSAFYIRTYIPVAYSSVTSISTSTKTWDGTTTTNPQTLSKILEDYNGICYVDWILNGATAKYTITYNYTVNSVEYSGTITIINNATYTASQG